MASICPDCGNNLEEGDRYCSNCGWKNKSIIKKDVEKTLDKISLGYSIFTYGLFGGILFIIGIMFVISAIITGFLKMINSPLYAIIGIIWGIVIGTIPGKIGQWLIQQISDEKVSNTILQGGAVIGFILGLFLVPSYLAKVSLFY